MIHIFTEGNIRSVCKVQAIQTSSKLFFAFFLHHLIAFELLITNIYFLALANSSFRSKNTKYSKGVVFFKKHNFFKICIIFHFLLVFSFCKYFFQIQHEKLNINMLLNRLQTKNCISGGASNRVESTTYRSIF